MLRHRNDAVMGEMKMIGFAFGLVFLALWVMAAVAGTARVRRQHDDENDY